VNRDRSAEISVPAESRYVALARNFVMETAREAGWLHEEQLDDLRLIASEVVTNAVRAQSESDPEAVIAIRTIASPQRFTIVVTDSAGGFDTPTRPEPVPSAQFDRTGGFGLSLISALADESTFRAVEGGTQVTVVIHRRDGSDDD
jgi:serine/threonine-protein kinase RsbW